MGTKDALNHVTNIIINNIDKNKPIAIAFLDLAKAFDTVDHEILLEKLECYGVRGLTNKLFTSYLADRQQRVVINGQCSDYMTVNTGVPQGTILGPLLFIIYINDLLNEIPGNDIISYADDTALISEDTNWIAVEEKMNKHLDKVANWLSLNKLSLNIEKTVYMTLGSYVDSLPRDMNIVIRGKKVNRVDHCKYLGVIFDHNLKWNKHIENILKKTKYLIFLFKKLTKFMNINTLKMVYHALVHSIITYGIIAWGGAYFNYKNLLQSFQNNILKIIDKKQFEIFTKILNLQQTFTYESLLYHYKELSYQYTQSTSRLGWIRHRPGK